MKVVIGKNGIKKKRGRPRKRKKPVWVVTKLSGEKEFYDEAKVADSIFLAAQDVGGTDKKLAKEIALGVTSYLLAQFGRMKVISTRDIGDAVERVLMEKHHVKTAKAYILNRDRKREEAEAKIRLGVRDDLGMSLNSLVVMKSKYLKKDSQGEVTESPRQAIFRVAGALAEAETNRRNENKWREEFIRIMKGFKFLPGGRTLANAGTVNNQLANCFVLPFPDNIEGIFEVVKESSILKKNGGGVGFSFGKIRPKDDVVLSTSGKACGPVALMSILNDASDIFLQAGGRRSGNMVTLPVTHPDIFEFITSKEGKDNLPHINYSLAVTSKFMKAAKSGDDWDLINPRNGEVVRTVAARSILEQAARLAWENGDPGVIFIDRINKDNPTPQVGPLETVNLCGEQPLLPYEACNLGSVNVAVHLKSVKGRESTIGEYKVDWDELERTVACGIRMLDNAISVCTYPIKKIDKVVKSNRKIGLGIMGWADMLVRLGIPYDSKEALKLAEKVMKFIRDAAWKTSEELAMEKGSFANFEGSIWEKKGYKSFRNATTTTIAPTGSISMTAGCSYGIEPLYALAFYKKAMGEYELPEVNQDLVLALKRANGVYSPELIEEIGRLGTISKIEGIADKIKRIFVTAHEMKLEDHVRMQAAFQKYTDNAVSKTINLAAEAEAEDVMEAFELAWELKCKGITVYRDQSRETQVLNVGVNESEKKQEPSMMIKDKILSIIKRPKDECPQCGGKMVMAEGCKTCPSCAFSVCSV